MTSADGAAAAAGDLETTAEIAAETATTSGTDGTVLCSEMIEAGRGSENGGTGIGMVSGVGARLPRAGVGRHRGETSEIGIRH